MIADFCKENPLLEFDQLLARCMCLHPGIDEPDPDRHRRYHLDELILAVVDQFVSHKLFFPEGDLKSCRRRFEFRAQQAAQSEDFW